MENKAGSNSLLALGIFALIILVLLILGWLAPWIPGI